MQSQAVRAAKLEPLRLRIGTVEEQYQVWALEAGESLTTCVASPGPNGCLLLRCVIADDFVGHAYDFDLYFGTRLIHRRSGTTNGMGARSFFISCQGTAASADPLELRLQNNAREKFYVQSLESLPDFASWLSSPFSQDDFTLALLQHGVPGPETDRGFAQAAALTTAPGVLKAASVEFHYARLKRDELDGQVKYFRSKCAENGLAGLAIPCSWWGGTPPEVFERLDFQQVCWSETDNYDEGEPLKKLLGPKWDLRYGLTVPNCWANTPWQTMNSPGLNQLRQERMRNFVGIIEPQMKDMLAGYISENEPAYWAWDQDTDRNYPVRRLPLWADFNPCTVAAAKADGVELEPRDGLSQKERTWLQQNAARYMKANIDTLSSAGASGKLFTHALLGLHFPSKGTGYFHPYGEVARVAGAFTGVETLGRAELDGLWRVREWGPWGCVNREENDGFGTEWHVAMVQLEYMMGASLFNSYNWQAINEDNRAINYFNEFLSSVRENAEAVAGERSTGEKWQEAGSGPWLLKTRDELPWANALELRLRAKPEAAPMALWLTQGVSGPVIAWCLVEATQAREDAPSRIDLGDLTQCEQNNFVFLHLGAQPGWQIRCGEEGPDYRLLCELKKERRRSQYLLQHPGRANARIP